MARYYDDVGRDDDFYKCISDAGAYEPKDSTQNLSYNDRLFYWYHYQTMALHELRLGNAEKALGYMNQIAPDLLTMHDDEAYAQIYIRLGKYKEAAAKLANIVRYSKENLNGRNRMTLVYMSSNIENKKRDIQIMQDKLDRQHMKFVLNAVIIVFSFILIGVLTMFLLHQRRLNRRLAVALDKAEAANRTKTYFLRNMTHEINTPLNHIYGFAQIMSDRTNDFDEASIREMCDVICESSEHLIKLTRNIIEVADKASESDGLENFESLLEQVEKDKRQSKEEQEGAMGHDCTETT